MTNKHSEPERGCHFSSYNLLTLDNPEPSSSLLATSQLVKSACRRVPGPSVFHMQIFVINLERQYFEMLLGVEYK